MVAGFPRTTVGEVSLPRLICGSNWMLGYSHITNAKDQLIQDLFDTPTKVAKVVEVFARAGCNAFMSTANEFVAEALEEVQQRTGTEMIWITTPSYAEKGNPDTWRQSVDRAKALGGRFCFPHQSVVDPLLDVRNRGFHPLLTDHLCYVREAGMIPGLSTHTPEAILCADESNADVATYIQPYNLDGFLCQIEPDWLQRTFRQARRPVMTIKPLAAGKLHPLAGLNFVWTTLRDCDMVTIGTMSPYEAEEVIEISLACLEQRDPDLDLSFSRSKQWLVEG